jgi:hypothetical protein
MFKDDLRCSVWEQVQSRGVRSFAKFLTPSLISEAARMCQRHVGSNPLNLMSLVWIGVAYALDGTKSFANILTVTFKILMDAPNSPLRSFNPEPESARPSRPVRRKRTRKRAKKKSSSAR